MAGQYTTGFKSYAVQNKNVTGSPTQAQPLICSLRFAFVGNQKREFRYPVPRLFQILMNGGSQLLHRGLEFVGVLQRNDSCGEIEDLLFGWRHDKSG